jgi:hypothetical protein
VEPVPVLLVVNKISIQEMEGFTPWRGENNEAVEAGLEAMLVSPEEVGVEELGGEDTVIQRC